MFDRDFGWLQIEAENTPDPVKRSAGMVLDGEFYTLGGFDFVCVDGEGGQIWNTKVHRLEFNDDDDDDNDDDD